MPLPPDSTSSRHPADASPLDGLRVLDLSQVMAGPFCCMLLGDMGADVIKVEPPGVGDQTRKSMGFRMKGEDSPGFLALNRNKRSIALDLKSEAGRLVLHRLVETADILVENARPGVMKRLHADYDTVSKINPRLIYASISGFGQTGPWATRPGFDLIAQAMSGVLSATGTLGGDPVKCGLPVADLGAGMFAAYGILSAVVGRERSGRGQYIDTSLFDAAVALSVWESTEYWATGNSPQPLGTANRMSAPYQAFRGADGYFVIGAANQRLWLKLCGLLDRPDIRDDPRFLENVDRMNNREELAEVLQRIFVQKPADHWVSALLDIGVPAGPINDYHRALGSDHAQAREAAIRIPHPVEGEFNALGFAAKLSDTPAQVHCAPPLLDQHRDELLAELGLESAQGELAAAGAFGS
ncbi:CoA transferase [Rhodobacteraceae bacterium 2CG4]|uniref:CoA transferase n=1 Tax=Halovulum marinum TaxID=2662447 RepID=A0A6L5YZP1_9RHOB|nr:CoA transferase [Halovulum marinum]MSU89342.1 CoA transferase [Halovulum marinum]